MIPEITASADYERAKRRLDYLMNLPSWHVARNEIPYLARAICKYEEATIPFPEEEPHNQGERHEETTDNPGTTSTDSAGLRL